MPLDSVDRTRFASDRGDLFYAAAKSRVHDYLCAQGKTRFDDGTIARKGFFFSVLAVAFYGLALSNAYPGWMLLLFALGFGIAAILLAINVSHDAAHHSLTPHKGLNTIIQTVIFTILGASAYLWRMRHVKSHHVFPNVNGCDIDIDENWFLRLSPNQRCRAHQRYQHIYAPFIFWLVDLHTVFYQDFVYLSKKNLANMRDIRHPATTFVTFALCKIAHILIIYVVPITVIERPWWHVLLGSLAVTFVMSAIFVMLLIGTHFCEETAFPRANAKGELPHSWAYHALATSLDWSPNSRLANFIVGGANAHAAHHLFPNISHAHYVPVTKIVTATAAEFGLPYRRTTLPKMVASHFRFLRRMGQQV